MATSYDELPYADYAFPRTHPEHLFALSALCGRAAPPFARCRVLELGCARGANLLPMALDLPDSRFVGVDLSASQVAEARARAAALGLTNVTFRAESIEHLSDDAPFDYVLCHGVYSWVPPAVRDAILAACRDRLRPDGVAYVSFNALPGWNPLRSLRDYLHAHRPPGPARERIAHARRALAVLADSLRTDASPWSAWMRAELRALAEADDAYLFHEHLAPVNDAVYLRDFAAHAPAVLELLFEGAISAHAGPARYAAAAGLRPLASPIARLQAQSSDEVTTLRHTRIVVPEPVRAVLRLADGTRDRVALGAALPSDGRSAAERAGDCEEVLDWLASNALLLG